MRSVSFTRFLCSISVFNSVGAAAELFSDAPGPGQWFQDFSNDAVFLIGLNCVSGTNYIADAICVRVRSA